MKKSILLLAVMVFSIATFAQNTVKKSFSGVKRVKISTSSGSCEIKKSSGNTVEVELNHSLDERYFHPTIEQSGDRVEIGEEFNGRNFNGTIKWKISIPDGLRVTFKTGSGDLVVSDVNVELDAGTGSGDLEFTSVKGTLDAVTGSGNVELSKFSGEAKINTGSGNMNLSDSDGELTANCGSGDIRITQIKAEFSINTGSGNITGDKIALTGSSHFNTGSGRARITLAESAKFDIAINSGSGNAELNFNGNEIGGQVVMKASKEHGNISAPFDFDKTEEVENGGGRNNLTVVKTAQRGKGTNRIMLSTGSGDAILKK
ncbi:MAG: DUF4097 family beta strand repeat-containing protein [Bacteroidota bacterium]